MMYFWIIFVAIAMVVIWYFSKQNKYTSHWGPDKEDPVDILKQRFASGEIDEEEYEERKSVLKEDD